MFPKPVEGFLPVFLPIILTATGYTDGAFFSSVVMRPADPLVPVGNSLDSVRPFRICPSPRLHSTETDFAEITAFEEEMARMREEIAELRKEALERVGSLENKISEECSRLDAPTISKPPIQMSARNSSFVQEAKVVRLKEPIAQSASVPFLERPNEGVNDMDRLIGTHWKIMLNIGREPGTWMPKTWGVSGDRLVLNLEVCFENRQLYEREQFLGSLGNAHVCRVVHHELSIAPSMTEGSRTVELKDGGWRIAKGDGPLGTDTLKFFIECNQEIRHQGGDVYVPPGRIYCSCGHFLIHRPSGIKDELENDLDKLEERYDEVGERLAEAGLFSLNRIKLSKELFDIAMKAEATKKKLTEASVVEPDRSLLRVSRKGDVGLTREGGVCCKVQKGAITEFHILGRFSLAAVDPRNDDDDNNNNNNNQ